MVTDRRLYNKTPFFSILLKFHNNGMFWFKNILFYKPSLIQLGPIYAQSRLPWLSNSCTFRLLGAATSGL